MAERGLESQAPPAGADAEGAAARRPAILVIDDEEVIRAGCFQILSEEGYRVGLAENGAEGIELAKKLNPDVVLLDLRMPGISGLEVIGKLAELDPLMVTIVITGYATIEYAVQSMKSGAFDFMSKPFSPMELRMAVQRGLAKKKMLRDMEALRAEKKRMADYFASIVSHQMRTPIAAVSQYFEVILGDMVGEVPPPMRQMLTRAKLRLGQLLDLIEDWLGLARFDAEAIRKKFKPLDVAKAVEQQLDYLRPLFAERHLTVTSECAPGLAPVFGDERVVGEVIGNLLSNAMKYNRDGGSITVRATAADDACRIAVSDTGIGIPAEQIGFVFNEFYRVKNNATRDIPGTGLGLAIVKKIVDAHGGRVAVESVEGQGSTFSVYLPWATAAGTPAN